MKFSFLTLFPDLCRAMMSSGVLGRGVSRGLLDVEAVNIRAFAGDTYGTVDDLPYGGGPGMVMKAEPIVKAVESLSLEAGSRLLLLSPRGRVFNQSLARELCAAPRIAFICGRYEGIDERVRLLLQPEEISVGDFVLTGGEAAALVIADAVGRLIPGVLGCSDSLSEESFSAEHGDLEHPHYTRPQNFRGLSVPEVLLSGHHGEVAKWRREQSEALTRERRPDLLAAV